MISEHIPPGMQRVIQRLGDTPVAVFAADWRLLWWNRGWTALLGDPATIPPDERSLVRSRFPCARDRGRITGRRVVGQDPEASDRAIVADLPRVSARYPDDPRLTRLLRRTIDGNPRFAWLWREGAVATHAEDRKTVRHPAVGNITVDCDILTDSDLRVVIYTTEPGSEDVTKLDLTRVAGTTDAPARPARPV